MNCSYALVHRREHRAISQRRGTVWLENNYTRPAREAKGLRYLHPYDLFLPSCFWCRWNRKSAKSLSQRFSTRARVSAAITSRLRISSCRCGKMADRRWKITVGTRFSHPGKRLEPHSPMQSYVRHNSRYAFSVLRLILGGGRKYTSPLCWGDLESVTYIVWMCMYCMMLSLNLLAYGLKLGTWERAQDRQEGAVGRQAAAGLGAIRCAPIDRTLFYTHTHHTHTHTHTHYDIIAQEGALGRQAATGLGDCTLNHLFIIAKQWFRKSPVTNNKK